MLAKLNRRRAQFVLTKIDEILAWEQRKEAEKDTGFVELGRYLCEVWAGQYWRLENLKSFDEFLERRFPESRRKAYYLMSIHEHLPPEARRELKQVGWTKGLELAKLARSRRDGQEFDCATWLHKARMLSVAGLPVNLCYGERRRTGSVCATYCFDPGSFRETEISRSMRYFPRQESEFWVEVIIQKQDAAIETRKYRGSQLVCSAHGADFRMAMIHATLVGLEPSEPTDRL